MPPNEWRQAGEFLSKSHPELGRLAIMELLGDYVIAIPEVPSSPAESDYQVRALDISNPANPVTVQMLGRTGHPGNAHATFKRGNEVFTGSAYPNNAVRLEPDGSLTPTTWSAFQPRGGRGGIHSPWSGELWWTYSTPTGNAWLRLEDEITAEWDHLGLTGVVGFPNFMGNLLIYASDQSNTGMATYDISDPTNPVLLDVFNLPAEHPTFGGPYGLGGYWNEIYGHYMVFARRRENAGIQIVDFSDPTRCQPVVCP